MRVLLITDSRFSESLFITAFERLRIPATIFTLTRYKEIEHNLLYTEDVEMVFIGYTIFGHINTISSGMVSRFVEAGFGWQAKPLVAVGGYRATAALMEAGCSHQTVLMEDKIEDLICQILSPQQSLSKTARAG